MKRIFLIIFLSFLSTVCLPLPAQAKSYLIRADGSIDVIDGEAQSQIIRPLRQNEIEEMPVTPQPPPLSKTSRTEIVPLTQKEIEERGNIS